MAPALRRSRPHGRGNLDLVADAADDLAEDQLVVVLDLGQAPLGGLAPARAAAASAACRPWASRTSSALARRSPSRSPVARPFSSRRSSSSTSAIVASGDASAAGPEARAAHQLALDPSAPARRCGALLALVGSLASQRATRAASPRLAGPPPSSRPRRASR